MAKVIDVKAVGITGDFAGSVVTSGITIGGLLFGVMFEEVPDEQRDIFTFPEPVTVRHHETVPIDKLAAFTLRDPSQDPPGIFAISLRFGGSLISADTGDLFGESFHTINTFTHTQPDLDFLHVVRFINGNQEIRVDFVLRVASFI